MGDRRCVASMGDRQVDRQVQWYGLVTRRGVAEREATPTKLYASLSLADDLDKWITSWKWGPLDAGQEA